MKCAIGLCGHCQLGAERSSAGTGRCSAGRGRAAVRRCASCDAARARPDARGVEVRLLRRLPAQPARLRGRAAGARRRGRDRLLPGGQPRHGGGPLRRLAGRGLDHDARRTPSASSEVRAQSAAWSRSAPAPRPAASRRCATSPTSTTSCRSSTPRPSTSSTLATSTPISDHVHVDFELQGCPINKHQLLEVISAFLNERRPAIAAPQRLHRVQARAATCA